MWRLNWVDEVCQAGGWVGRGQFGCGREGMELARGGLGAWGVGHAQRGWFGWYGRSGWESGEADCLTD